MYLGDFADGTGLNPFAGEADALAGMALIAHLGDAFGLRSHVAHGTGLGDGVGEGLLHIDVASGAHGHDACRCMHVVRRGHEHGVDVLLLVDQFAVIAVELGIRVFFDRASGVIQIDVTKGHNVREAGVIQIPDVATALTTDADAAEIDLFTRRGEARATDDVTRDDLKAEHSGGGGFNELTTRNLGHLKKTQNKNKLLRIVFTQVRINSYETTLERRVRPPARWDDTLAR